MNSMEKLAEQIEQLGNVLKAKQEEIDRKQRDIEAYKECNEKLTKLIKIVVVSFLVVMLSLFGVLGYTVSQYKDLKSDVNTTTETTRQEFQTQDGGVIINGNNNSGDVNDGK